MIWNIIDAAMKRNDVKSIRELSELSGLSWSTLQHKRKKNPRGFLLWELQRLDKVLGFTSKEWEMLRVA